MVAKCARIVCCHLDWNATIVNFHSEALNAQDAGIVTMDRVFEQPHLMHPNMGDNEHSDK